MASSCGKCVLQDLLMKSCNYSKLVSGIRTTQIRTYAKAKNIHENVLRKLDPIEDEDFRVLVIPGHSKVQAQKRETRFKRKEVPPARYKRMKLGQDWTDVWPAAETFKWSVVPMPIRQGVVEGEENEGIRPGKYANAELMKIPNFLHLTPAHIKKHCDALKKFCTPWPKELATDEECDKHFPINVISSDYVVDGPSVRDARARVVTLKIKMSSLELDYHAKDKLLRLLGDRYNPKTDMMTITSDRCPMRTQNYDYAHYVLTAVYHEAWNVEPWESEKEEADMEKYFWDLTQSRKSAIDTVQRIKKISVEKNLTNTPEGINDLSTEPTEEDIVNLEAVKQYKNAVSELHNEGEDIQSLEKYKQSVVNLLFGQAVKV